MTKKQFDFLFNKAKELMKKTKDPVHDWGHIKRTIDNVFEIKKLLSKQEQKKLDDKILTLGAAWHDVAFVYYKPGIINYFLEGSRAAKITKKYCKQASLQNKETKLICDIIRWHTGSSTGRLNKHKTLYHQIIQDADTLESYNSPIRLKQSKIQGDKVHWYDWYGFVNKILKPMFFKFLKKHPSKIYNLPHIVEKIIK